MGKIAFTPLQKKVFDAIAAYPEIQQSFYFTGGTALSVFYYGHRYSEDLDFFSEKEFDSQIVSRIMDTVCSGLHLQYRFTDRQIVRVFQLTRQGKPVLKVDFGYYPYKRIEKGSTFQGIAIDSLRDIGANKLITIVERMQVKDFVDLYFLLQNDFTLWDLIYAVEHKFHREIDLLLIVMDFLKVGEFKALPRMRTKLTLPQLQTFFKSRSRQLAQRFVE